MAEKRQRVVCCLIPLPPFLCVFFCVTGVSFARKTWPPHTSLEMMTDSSFTSITMWKLLIASPPSGRCVDRCAGGPSTSPRPSPSSAPWTTLHESTWHGTAESFVYAGVVGGRDGSSGVISSQGSLIAVIKEDDENGPTFRNVPNGERRRHNVVQTL